MKTRLLILSAAGLVLAAAWGCASARVDPETVQVAEKPAKPSAIYVQAFDTSSGQWKADRQGAELDEFKKTLSSQLMGMLIERLQEIATAQPARDPLASSGLLVTGRFLSVDQGSRALRSGVGFGAGATQIETQVTVYNLAASSTEPVFRFKTTGTSGSMPGLLGGGIDGAAGGVTAGLQDDLTRTAREIRTFIADHLD